MPDAAKNAWIETLRRLLAEALRLHQKGAAGVPLGRAYGIADGYMLALLEMGAASPTEIRRVVAEERERQLGPATCGSGLPEPDPDRDTLAA
ncbi:MAG TPA: hypothetical protein VG963_34040 [Polyangiaceae bacterium]|nr:hypothetical protein [Polyangiaceae bacterium]